MKILYIHQYFKTPEEGGSIRSYHLAKSLVSAGHEVVVLTAKNQHQSSKVMVEGVRVHYLPVYYSNALSFDKRLKAFALFIFSCLKYIHAESPFDKAYIMTTPLTTGLLGIYIRVFLRKPYVFEVGDLWPEVPIQMGIINNKLIIWLLRIFEKLCYRCAEHIVGLSPAISGYIKKIVPHHQVTTITNIADTDFFDFVTTPFVRGKEPFTISYIGTAGLANRLEQLLAVAIECEKQDVLVRFIIQAEGAKLKSIRYDAQHMNNVVFRPYGNKESVKEILDISDAVYLSFDQYPVLGTGSPNKLFDGLAAGKLIITNFQGWITTLIVESNCGFTYSPTCSDVFIAEVRNFILDPEKLVLYQRNARKLAFRYNLDRASEQINAVIKS